jgi:hypothetical protein
MATQGELTVGKLKEYLNCYPDNTKVVLGQKGTDEVLKECWANSYYPRQADETEEDRVWVVIDAGQHW